MYPGPPSGVSEDWPHCSTNIPLVVSRWQVIPLKKSLFARSIKLATACGANTPSSSISRFAVPTCIDPLQDLPSAIAMSGIGPVGATGGAGDGTGATSSTFGTSAE